MTIDWRPLQDIILANQRFVLTTHVRPDADALGSELAMLGILEALGKDVRIVNASATPARLAFLDPRKRIEQLGTTVTEEQAKDTDAHFILDTSAWSQLAEMGRIYRHTPAVKAVIDHHASAEDIGGIPFKDTLAEATGTLVYRLAKFLHVKITEPMAIAMYCAIATDTGWFRFPSTTSETMHIIGDLIDAGARPDALYQQLYERSTLARLKLVSRVTGRATLECNGRLGHTYVRLQDYVETGAEPADTEDLVNECLSVTGTEAAFILIEQSNGNIKASLRSRRHLDVAKVAEKFNGGGHKQASGAILPGPFADAQQKVLAAMSTLWG